MTGDPEAARFSEIITPLDSHSDETICVLDLAAQRARHWGRPNTVAVELLELRFYFSFIDLESRSFLWMVVTELSRQRYSRATPGTAA